MFWKDPVEPSARRAPEVAITSVFWRSCNNLLVRSVVRSDDRYVSDRGFAAFVAYRSDGLKEESPSALQTRGSRPEATLSYPYPIAPNLLLKNRSPNERISDTDQCIADGVKVRGEYVHRSPWSDFDEGRYGVNPQTEMACSTKGLSKSVAGCSAGSMAARGGSGTRTLTPLRPDRV